MNANATPRQNSNEVDLGRLIGLLIDHKWVILGFTLVFTIASVIYVLLATPIYQGDALVQVEQRSSVSPLGDLANIMGDTELQADRNNSTAAEVQILQSRMVLGQVVDRVGLETQVLPKQLPVVGDFVQRHDIPRPGILSGHLEIAGWLPDAIALPESLRQSELMPDMLKGSIGIPDFFKGSIAFPDILGGRSAIWGGEHMRLGLFEVTDDRLLGEPLILRTGGNGEYSLTLDGEEHRELGTGRVGELADFADGAIRLRVAELQAPEGAQFTLIKRTRPMATRDLAQRLTVTEEGAAPGNRASTGMLRLALIGPDPEAIRRSLDAVTETFLTQNVERQSAEAEQSLAFLNEQAPQLRDKLAAAEESLNQYRVEQDSVDLNSEAQAVIQQFVELDSRLSELEFQEAEMAQRYTPSHPTYQALLRQKSQLEERRAALDERVDELPEAQQEVVRRTRDVEVNQAIYVSMLNKMQELQVARAGTVGNVRIIDEALVAEEPIQPRQLFIVALATVLGGLITAGVVLARGLLNKGIEAPEQLEEVGLPVYATVPLSDEQKKLVKRIKHRSDREASEVAHGVLAERAPADTSMEALRGLRTSLHFAMLEAADNRLMITGPSPGIGKSFVALNLGAICAQAGQRVLVVDADMRKGHLHNALGGQSEGGLSELLSGRRDVDGVIRSSGIEGLDYVARGTAPPNPSELLMTAGFTRFLEEIGKRYDLVIVDTPPALAVTDAALVGAQCGTTLLVARYQVNPVRELQLAKRRLENGGVTVKGAILNAMERKAVTNYSYGYYQYAYK
ncbi:polysaccharide biosynthesis tyrosine autokinase [Halomonas sp. TRM85114]|uniref:polysaccharide biosynthesis tyrosine autokinase n=1 Tax=Halomonas jincaotanensis TaxID=2810616 RepID=UPI001BD48A87|nr:polysaccharide biosynthesis tyrosine autokinase [Halomonas jincaotanensis]MBS9404042.1 polysaccharide biosynthesis tyrosine autokinase [Halomonas jincaotanensis]